MTESFCISHFLDSGSLISTKPGNILLGWGKRTWLPKCGEEDRPYFYFPDYFFTHKEPWFQHEYTLEMPISSFLKLLTLPTPPPTPPTWQELNKNFFLSTFQQIKAWMKEGKLTKAVPFLFQTSPTTMSPEQLATSLLSILQYAATYPLHVYGFWDKTQGILGATPEVLFTFHREKEHWKISSPALAGTASCQEEIFFRHDPKNQVEHEIVIQGIVESLSRWGECSIGSSLILEFPFLLHLYTPIVLTTSCKPEFEELVQLLHPTPALGAYPRQEGLQWLRQLQLQIDRKRFGAPVGYVHPQAPLSQCFVAIRNVHWDDQELRLGAGCGIVPSSDFALEWQELHLKLQSIKKILAL